MVTRATIVSSSPTSAPIVMSSLRPSRCWLRPRADGGGSSGRASIRDTAAAAGRRSTRRSAGGSSRTRPVSPPPSRRASAMPERGDTHAATREWLVTNGLGGYASGTVSGVVTRRYHGLLIAALPAPHGRVVMLSHLWDRLRLPDRTVAVLSGEELDRDHLADFHLDTGLPVWRYELGGFAIEREIRMPHRQNTVHVTYRLVGGAGDVRLTLRPSLNFRPHHAPVSTPLQGSYAFTAIDGRYELSAAAELPRLRLRLVGERSAFTVDGKIVQQIRYHDEAQRGEAARGDLWSPGY